jgi:hypothetical protein
MNISDWVCDTYTFCVSQKWVTSFQKNTYSHVFHLCQAIWSFKTFEWMYDLYFYIKESKEYDEEKCNEIVHFIFQI